MMSKIIFVGGIHGVGKSMICQKISEQTNAVHKKASEIIKWGEISESGNKKVVNIQDTQDKLIAGLEKIRGNDETYLLDGHFCLRNTADVIEKIPMDTFEKIAPMLLVIITEKIDVIKKRLDQRDNKIHDTDMLRNMQITEIGYAQQVSLELEVPLVEIKNGNYRSLIKEIR